MLARLPMTCLVLIALAAPAAPAFAQRKADPVPVDTAAPTVDYTAFKRAYADANMPRMLVGVTVNDDALEMGKFVARVSGLDDGPEKTSHSMAAARAIEEVLLRNADVDLVDRNMIAVAAARERAILAGQNEQRVLDTLRNEMKTDLLLMVQLLQDPDVQRRGGRYRVTVDGIDTLRGRRLTTFTFDWMQGVDAATSKRYGEQIARKFVEQFAHATRGGERMHQVTVMGLEDIQELLTLKRTLSKMPGFVDVIARDFRRSTSASDNRGRETNVAMMRLRYDGGQLELIDALDQAVIVGLRREAEFTNADGGLIHLRLKRGAPLATASGAWDKDYERDLLAERLVDYLHDDPASEQVLDSFRQVYLNEGSPKIGVVLNRRIDQEAESVDDVRQAIRDQIADGGGDAATPPRPAPRPAPHDGGVSANATPTVSVNVGNQSGGGQGGFELLLDRQEERAVRREERQYLEGELERIQRQRYTTRLMEDGVSQRLRRMGLNMVDATFVKNKILQKAANAAQVFEEHELERLLQQEAKAAGLDIVLIGFSFISNESLAAAEGSAGNSRRLGFTVRAVSLSDGAILGSISFAEAYAQFDLQQQVDAAADYIAGNLAAQLWDAWVPPKVITVTVFNAKTPRDVLAVMDALELHVDGIQQMDFQKHEAGREGGIGIFNLRYEGDYDPFLRRISNLGPEVPFDLDARGISRGELNLRIRDGN